MDIFFDGNFSTKLIFLKVAYRNCIDFARDRWKNGVLEQFVEIVTWRAEETISRVA